MSSPANKAEFKSSDGKTWLLHFTIGMVRRLRAEMGFDFADLQGGKALMEVGNDPEKYGQLLWVLCEKQADLAKISEEDFAESLDGDAVESSATALELAIVNFTRKSARSAVRNVMKQAATAQEAAMEVVEDWTEGQSETLKAKVKKVAMETLENSGAILRD